jgi:hypothetical protein
MKEGINGGTRFGCEKLSNCFEGSSSSFINKACHQVNLLCFSLGEVYVCPRACRVRRSS